LNAVVTSTACLAALLLLSASSQAQLGATREQLMARYGSCKPESGAQPSGPNAYDAVIDVGTHCYFSDGPLRVMALFKSERVVGLHFSKSPTLWESLFHPFAYSYLPLSDAEISSLLHSAAPGAVWVAGESDDTLHRWHTSDDSATAYYFAGGHNELYRLVVQTAAVDEVFRRIEHY